MDIKRILISGLLLSSIVCTMNTFAQNKTIELTINPEKVTGQISAEIYGQLLEHIYHSINGGLWGELVESRSFEPIGSGGWYLEGDEIGSHGYRLNPLAFGSPKWTDYELSCEVCWRPYYIIVREPWTSGEGNLRLIFRGPPDSAAYALHVNTYSNIPLALEKNVQVDGDRFYWRVLKAADSVLDTLLSSRQWHRVREIHCAGPKVIVTNQLTIDNKPVLNRNYPKVDSGSPDNLRIVFTDEYISIS